MDRISRRITRLGAAFILLSFTQMPTASADAGTEFLKALSGKWKGRGTVQNTADSKPEAVACSIGNTLAGSNKVTSSGACAGAQAKAKVAGTLTYNPQSGGFSGRLLSTGSGEGTSTSRGTLSGKSLRLQTVRFDNRQNVIARGSVRISLQGNDTLVIVSDETEVKTNRRFTSGNITLKRQ